MFVEDVVIIIITVTIIIIVFAFVIKVIAQLHNTGYNPITQYTIPTKKQLLLQQENHRQLM